MNKCPWCGRENEPEAVFCAACSTRVAPEVMAQEAVPPVLAPPILESRSLTASRALLVLLLFLVVQMAAGLPIGMLAGLMGTAQGKDMLDPVQRKQAIEASPASHFPVCNLSVFSLCRLQSAIAPVAQTSSLLYRGFPIRQRHLVREPADWKSAIQQVGNLRYGGRALQLQASFHGDRYPRVMSLVASESP